MEKKIKFNFVDVIIILAVVAMFVFGINFVKKGVTTSQQYPKISFTVEIKCMPEDYDEKFKIGDKICDSVKGDTFGVVTNITSKPATDLVEKSDEGVYSIAEYKNREDVYITIEGTPTQYGADVIIAQQKIKVGEMLYIKNIGTVGRGYVVEMKTEEQGAISE